jgi:hypothetical protein
MLSPTTNTESLFPPLTTPYSPLSTEISVKSTSCEALPACCFQLFFTNSLLDAGFGQFVNILKWVCWKRGVYLAEVNKDYTSQVCPQCDTHTGKKKLALPYLV